MTQPRGMTTRDVRLIDAVIWVFLILVAAAIAVYWWRFR